MVRRRSRFTRQQRLVLVLMGLAVALVFGTLAFTVISTLSQTEQPASPVATPTRAPDTPTVELPPPESPTPTEPPPTPTTVSTPVSQLDSARAVNELSRIVAGVRGLPPVEQIPISFSAPREVVIWLLQRYQDEQPQRSLALYQTLGLLPPLDALPQPDPVIQAANISSLYLPDEREILLIIGRGPTTVEYELAVVHALARAIQDQQFNLETMAPCRAGIDAELALRALIAGDAIVTTALYAGAEIDDAGLERLADMVAAAAEPAYPELAESAIYERIRLFPYREGARFVANLYREGGWSAVNRAYARPPCSTEQILHPEQYDAREPVQYVALPDLRPALGAGWSLERQETLGELLVGLHLAAAIENDEAARDAVDGWAGDAFALWESEEGEQLLAWRIAWDSVDSAIAFEQVYRLLAPRFRVPPLIRTDLPHDLPGRLWAGPAGAAYLSRAGRVTTIVWGPDAATTTAVAENLP